jgi:uncharacterized protein (UPF0179 family)
MDRHSITAIHSLNFLLALFPDDDAARSELKKDLKVAVVHCEALKVEAAAEEEKARAGTLTKVATAEQRESICPIADFKEPELSEWKKEQLIAEALLARDQLRATLEEMEAHLVALQPSDEKVVHAD